MAALGHNDRKHKRKALIRRALLVLDDNSSARECVVLDFSDSGARLQVDAAPLPEKFMLWLSRNGTVRRACHLVWQKDGEAGVQFLKRRAAAARSLSANAELDSPPLAGNAPS